MIKIKGTIDRIEENKAVVLDENENEAVIPAIWIPEAHEGMAVNMIFESDPAREKEEWSKAEEMLKHLKK